jgi:hypothetical protein
MGRPLKIQKFNAMSGIFYDNSNQGTTAKSVSIDQGYPPFAAPTSMELATVVLPQPVTTALPFTGVVGGERTPFSAPSASFPVVQCQVNIALPDGTGAGVASGAIIRQKGAHKFMVVDLDLVEDEDIVSGASYQIRTVGTTNWLLLGAPVGYAVGTTFTATATGSDLGTGQCHLIGTCVLSNSGTPTAGNMSVTISIADSTPTYVSKLTNRFVQDFFGGATGGNANTGEAWNSTQIANDIEYAANFFVDGETFAKSGAETETWAGTNQNSNGTLTMAAVEKYTS